METAIASGNPAASAEKADSGKDIVARMAEFAELSGQPSGSVSGSLDHLLEVCFHVTAELGKTTLSIGEVLKLGPGAVIELDRQVTDPVEVLVQGVPLARGEVVVVDDHFAIRIKEIVEPKKRV